MGWKCWRRFHWKRKQTRKARSESSARTSRGSFSTKRQPHGSELRWPRKGKGTALTWNVLRLIFLLRIEHFESSDWSTQTWTLSFSFALNFHFALCPPRLEFTFFITSSGFFRVSLRIFRLTVSTCWVLRQLNEPFMLLAICCIWNEQLKVAMSKWLEVGKVR